MLLRRGKIFYCRVDEDDKMTITITDSHSGKRGGAQYQTVINESGLYTLVMGSRKAEAKAFKKWVTSEVLPAIRKTGKYEIEEDPSMYLANAVLIANKMIQGQNQTIADQQCLIELLEPKPEVFDAIVASTEEIPIDGMAKLLGYKPRGFYEFIRKMKYVRKDKMPAAQMMDGGYMTYKETPWANVIFSGISIVPYFLPKAIQKLRKYTEKIYC
jgi:prophage antirepressor-like protein